MSGLSIAKSLELTLLRATITDHDVRSGCELAGEHHLAAVCVYPVHVELAAQVLAGSDTRVCAAIGFPFGQESAAARLVSIDQAQRDGADDVAIMLNHFALAAGDVDRVCAEVDRICASNVWSSLTNARALGDLTLVVESTLYDCASLDVLWQRLHETPVGFLQTSSGYQPRAVTEDHVRAMRELLPEGVAIKAVGGVATLAEAMELLAAGAVRVGSGSAIAIAQEELRQRQVRHAP